MVPISPIRSVIEITRVFMMTITATTAMTSTSRLKTHLKPDTSSAMPPAASTQPYALTGRPPSWKCRFNCRISRCGERPGSSPSST